MRDGPPYHHGGMHILVVEDEGKVARAIKEGRERQRHRRGISLPREKPSVSGQSE